MTRVHSFVVAFVIAGSALAAAPRPTAPQPEAPSLKERFPPPAGYRVEDENDDDETLDFSTARGVKGHTYRQTLTLNAETRSPSTADVVRHYANLIRKAGGVLLDDHIARSGGRFNGRIAVARPVWLEVEIGDAGHTVAVTALEEDPPTRRDTPTEEEKLAGTWATGVSLDGMPAADRPAANAFHQAFATLVAPVFQPLRGWAWRVTLQEPTDASLSTPATYPYRLYVYGLAKFQACSTCPVNTASEGVTIFTVDVNRVESVLERDQTTLPADGLYLDPQAQSAAPQVSSFRDGGRLLVVHAGRPALYQPVPREAYLQARLRFVQGTGRNTQDALAGAAAEFDRAMKELEKTSPAAAAQARIEFAEGRKTASGMTAGEAKDLDRELAGLSAEEKRAPAVDLFGNHIVRVNPAYFDRARGRTAPHFVVVDIPTRYDVGAVSLYQHSLIEKFLEVVPLVALVK